MLEDLRLILFAAFAAHAMSDYTSFALVGCTGNFGTFILDELKKCPDDRITILSRRSVEVPQGVCLKIIDYSHPAELEEALKGVEVIISTVGPGGLESQVSLAQAARKAGVQLFVPSEFGNPTNGIKDESSPLFVKKKVQDSLKATGMPYLLVFNGPFADMTFSPYHPLCSPREAELISPFADFSASTSLKRK